jgi:hypothetical protein
LSEENGEGGRTDHGYTGQNSEDRHQGVRKNGLAIKFCQQF